MEGCSGYRGSHKPLRIDIAPTIGSSNLWNAGQRLIWNTTKSGLPVAGDRSTSVTTRLLQPLEMQRTAGRSKKGEVHEIDPPVPGNGIKYARFGRAGTETA